MKSIKMALLASTLILGMGISAEAVSAPATTTHHTDNTRTFEQGKLPNVPLKVGATFKQLEALEPKAKKYIVARRYYEQQYFCKFSGKKQSIQSTDRIRIIAQPDTNITPAQLTKALGQPIAKEKVLKRPVGKF